jgi:pilus assembly protein CpaB
VTRGPRRRRAAILLSLALACGGLAASKVHSRTAALEHEVGPLVPVVAASRDIAPGAKIEASELTVREVPQHFVPPDTLASPEEAVGVKTQAGIPAGGYITQGAVAGRADSGRDAGLRPGERALEISVTGGQALAGAGPGARVDVLITTEHRSFLALEDAELLALRQGSEGDNGSKSLATLRVSLRQAVYLAAAQSFARETRLLPRPAGDAHGAGSLSVSASAL